MWLCTNVIHKRAAHVAFACLSGFLLGYDLCVIGSILTPVQRTLQLCYPCDRGDTDDALAHCTCAAKQLAVSSVSFGAIAGGVTGGWLADRFGRRLALSLTDGCFVVAAVAMANAWPGWGVFLFFGGRVLAGLALGAAGVISTAYLAELSPPSVRGMLLNLNELGVCFGCLTGYLVPLALGDELWRWTVGVAAVPAIAQLVGLLSFLQESPRWLSEQGHSERAAAVAATLGLDASPLLTPLLDASPCTARVSLHTHRRPLLLAAGCALAHAASGANVVLYYSRDILQAAQLPEPLLANVGVGVVKLLGVAVCVASVDYFGRRKLLIVGSAGMILAYVGLAIAFSGAGVASGGSSSLALVCLLLFVLAWDMSWAGLMMTVAAELLPQPVRGVGLGLTYSLYWALSFTESQTLESAFDALGHTATFGLYAASTSLALVFSVCCVPETHGVSLEAIAPAGGGARAKTSDAATAPSDELLVL